MNKHEETQLKEMFEGVGVELTEIENHGIIIFNMDTNKQVITSESASIQNVANNIRGNVATNIQGNQQIQQQVRMEMERALLQLEHSQK